MFSHFEPIHVHSNSRLLPGSSYSHYDSDYSCIGPPMCRTYASLRRFSSTVNTDEKLNALKKKKEAKRTERLARQRTNELKRSVSICISVVLNY